MSAARLRCARRPGFVVWRDSLLLELFASLSHQFWVLGCWLEDEHSAFGNLLLCCLRGVSESVSTWRACLEGPLALRNADRSMFTDDSLSLFSVASPWLERGVGLCFCLWLGVSSPLLAATTSSLCAWSRSKARDARIFCIVPFASSRAK